MKRVTIQLVIIAMICTASHAGIEITASEDTFVRGGIGNDIDNTNTNYGNADVIRTKSPAMTSTTTIKLARKSYLKFDLSDYGQLETAILKVQAADNFGVGIIRVFMLTDETLDNWAGGDGTVGSGITWNTAPANDTTTPDGLDTTKVTQIAEKTIARDSLAAGDIVTFDLASHIDTLNSSNGNGLLTLILTGYETESDMTDELNFRSLESTVEGAIGPMLDITVTPEPATMLLLGLGGLLICKTKRNSTN